MLVLILIAAAVLIGFATGGSLRPFEHVRVHWWGAALVGVVLQALPLNGGLGTAAVVRAALPHLERSRGRLVTVASTLGLRALSDATAYCASKFGVVGFTRSLAVEMAGRVGVTLLVPGGMQTAFFDARPEKYRPPPDARLAAPSDVAEAVVFALSRPPGTELRELVVCPSTEPSWP